MESSNQLALAPENVSNAIDQVLCVWFIIPFHALLSDRLTMKIIRVSVWWFLVSSTIQIIQMKKKKKTKKKKKN